MGILLELLQSNGMGKRMNKINVVQVCNQLGIEGTEKDLWILTEHLDKDIFKEITVRFFIY
jgi:hypothetical protein